MNQEFKGWEAVANALRQHATDYEKTATEKGEGASRLNEGQRASLRAIASRIMRNGVLIADEVGMGKTRIAVEVARCVTEAGGRVAILVPPGLGYQWQAELRDGEIDGVPGIIRSLYGYLDAWDPEAGEKDQPWFELKTVLISHGLTNWRLGERTESWRWALLPEIYAHWRDKKPRGYHGNERLEEGVCRKAAKSIADAIPTYQKRPRNPARRLLDKMLLELRWPLDSAGYSKYGELRKWLERAVGIGLGVFDLVILDEAHKSRGENSGLSGLLDNVILSNEEGRKLCVTATPMELDIGQWYGTLCRVGLDDTAIGPVQEAISEYARAVDRIRNSWRSSEEAREAYKLAAGNFGSALSPYLLRRDKREDPSVLCFKKHSGMQFQEYRKTTEILVETNDLSPAWRKAICAAESLSVVTRQSEDSIAKRLRLTVGNGHGIATLLDKIHCDKEDQKQEFHDDMVRESEQVEKPDETKDFKRHERAQWWQGALKKAFTQGGDSLFDHPAIIKAVESIEKETQVDAIEKKTQQGQKVLVFGRFTRPLRALVELLNAREMLRRLADNKPWPQSKVHGDRDGIAEDSEWPAVLAAHRQLKSPLQVEQLDEQLRIGSEHQEQRRKRFRDSLVSRIEEGWQTTNRGAHFKAVFDAFKFSIDAGPQDGRGDRPSLVLLARAMMELLGEIDDKVPPSDYSDAFCELILAVSDRDTADDDSDEIDEVKVANLWQKVEGRLKEEFDRPQGGFARLMYGGTSPESRRMIQLAFNRPNSFPRVLVAQSMVGREGLNLHKSCRIVVLLHPEWNPAVVEQQIGRIDRVDSHWCKELQKAIDSNKPADQLPRIEVRPVIFQGTYDEYNWQVLRSRWNDLRAQLHGIVIPPSVMIDDAESQALVDEISSAAPNFSPNR